MRSDWNAETKAAHWLAEANAAGEAGKREREAKCLEKAQFWLDRANRARERSESC